MKHRVRNNCVFFSTAYAIWDVQGLAFSMFTNQASMKLRKALNRKKFSGFQLCIKYWHYNSYRRLIWLVQRKRKELVEPPVNYRLKISLSTVREDEFNLEVF